MPGVGLHEHEVSTGLGAAACRPVCPFNTNPRSQHNPILWKLQLVSGLGGPRRTHTHTHVCAPPYEYDGLSELLAVGEDHLLEDTDLGVLVRAPGSGGGRGPWRPCSGTWVRGRSHPRGH